jgi:hypothetical protein
MTSINQSDINRLTKGIADLRKADAQEASKEAELRQCPDSTATPNREFVSARSMFLRRLFPTFCVNLSYQTLAPFARDPIER